VRIKLGMIVVAGMIVIVLRLDQLYAATSVDDLQRLLIGQSQAEGFFKRHADLEEQFAVGQPSDLPGLGLEDVRLNAGRNQNVNLDVLSADALDKIRLRRDRHEHAYLVRLATPLPPA